MILVDSSVWIDFFTGKDTHHRYKLHELIQQEAEICITEVVLAEVLQGIKDDKAYESTKHYLVEFPIVRPGGIETYISAADIYRKCRKQGKTVRKTIDCIIAAIAVEHNLTLLHNDSDFEQIRECTRLRTLMVSG